MNSLKKLRKEKGMTQRELGEKIGMSQIAISLYENDRRVPKIRVAQKIANVFDKNIEDIFFDPKISKRKENNDELK